MTADELRQAAALMRELAGAVPQGDWIAYELTTNLRTGDSEWIVDSGPRLIAGNIGISSDPVAEPLAQHIASWHPAVALAVAEMLEMQARQLDHIGTGTGTATALAVARAYLGESA